MASGGTEQQLQQVVVTATRRAESENKVPESIVALSAADLESKGIRSAEDLAQFAPGVDVSQTLGINTSVSIRGISNTVGQQSTGAATTGIYLDDTPIQIRSIGNGPGNPLPDVFDLARVEVLRGPQGTLFGAGSEGGALRFIFAEPSLFSYSGFGRTEIAFTQNGGASYDLGAAGGGPLIDGVLGFRLSAHERRDGGFVDRIPYPPGAGPDPAVANANSTDTVSTRAALLWRPIDSLEITPSVYLSQINSNDTSQYWVALSDPSRQRYISGNGQPSPDDDGSSLASVRVNWDTGTVAMISNTAYYHRSESNLSDYRVLLTNTFGPLTGQDPFPVFATPGYYDNGLIDNTQSDWTQEIRLQSTDPHARITWLTGVFYQDNRQLNYQNLRTPYLDLEAGIPDAALTLFGIPLIGGQYSYIESIVTHDRQWAGFGQVDASLTSRLKLTVGLRASRTEDDYFDSHDGPIAGGQGQDRGRVWQTPKTRKYGISYQFRPDDMVYASLSDGFRIGGVNQTVDSALCGTELASLGYTTAPRTYGSDRVRQLEIGAKLSPARDFRLSLSGYHIDWFNIIQPVDLVTCGQTFTANLGKAVSEGADVEAEFAPVESMLFDLMVNYDDARFTKTVLNPTASADIVRNDWTLGQTPWTIVAGWEYRFQRFFGQRAYFRTDATFHSKNSGVTAVRDPDSVSYNPLLRPDPSTLDVRLRLGVMLAAWDISVFVDNATNDHPLLNLQNDSPGGAIAYATPVRPLTVGLTVKASFP